MGRRHLLACALLAGALVGCGEEPGAVKYPKFHRNTKPISVMVFEPGTVQISQARSRGQEPDIDPALKAQFESLGNRLKGLGTDQQKAVAALQWQDTKDRTVAQMLERDRSWSKNPSLYFAYMNGLIDQAKGLSAADVQALLSQTPPEILEGGGPSAQPPS